MNKKEDYVPTWEDIEKVEKMLSKEELETIEEIRVDLEGIRPTCEDNGSYRSAERYWRKIKNIPEEEMEIYLYHIIKGDI